MGGGAVPGLKVDRGIPRQPARVPEAATAAEDQRYDGYWAAETNHDASPPLRLAAEHTTRLEIGTSVAVAFARNPMTVPRRDGVIDRVLPAFPPGLYDATATAVRREVRGPAAGERSHP